MLQVQHLQSRVQLALLASLGPLAPLGLPVCQARREHLARPALQVYLALPDLLGCRARLVFLAQLAPLALPETLAPPDLPGCQARLEFLGPLAPLVLPEMLAPPAQQA